jgi:predicted ATP-dependent endonuclease of OLD family
LPDESEESAKFVRDAVHTYPEMYFARFVVLGEGSSEKVALPRLAEAIGYSIGRSFVAVGPLGGRHVKHLWRRLIEYFAAEIFGEQTRKRTVDDDALRPAGEMAASRHCRP